MCVLHGQSRRGHLAESGILLLPLQSELAEWFGKREQFIHSQHQTFNFQINPMSWHCRMENQPHLSKHVRANLRTSCGFSYSLCLCVCTLTCSCVCPCARIRIQRAHGLFSPSLPYSLETGSLELAPSSMRGYRFPQPWPASSLLGT